MHLAAALGTPLVAVFGSTDWTETAPVSARARVVREEVDVRALPAARVPDRPPLHDPRRRRPRGRRGAGARRVVSPKKRPAIFMDRDGTLSHEVGYVNHPSRFRLYPWTVDAVRAINRAGWLAVVVTNQAGVARGYFPESVFEEVQQRLREGVEAGGARFDAIYACLHHPSVGRAAVPARTATAASRGPGMLRRARGGARRRPRALVGDRRPPRRPAARLERRGARARS